MKTFICALIASVSFVLLVSAASFGPVNSSTEDLPPGGIARPESTPLRQLDDIIAVTEKSAIDQKQLRRQLSDYYKVKARYLQDEQNKDNIIQLVKAAHLVQQSINSQHLQYLFDSDLLEELNFFSQIASKKGLPRP